MERREAPRGPVPVPRGRLLRRELRPRRRRRAGRRAAPTPSAAGRAARRRGFTVGTTTTGRDDLAEDARRIDRTHAVDGLPPAWKPRTITRRVFAGQASTRRFRRAAPGTTPRRRVLSVAAGQRETQRALDERRARRLHLRRRHRVGQQAEVAGHERLDLDRPVRVERVARVDTCRQRRRRQLAQRLPGRAVDRPRRREPARRASADGRPPARRSAPPASTSPGR